jgi:steroid delta-isomerase-like uncharacterized protein
MPGENTTRVTRIPEEIFNRGNVDAVDELFTSDFIEHVRRPPGVPAGVAGFKQFVIMVRSAFPDFRYTVEDTVEDGDTVVVRVSAHGTMKGDFMGMPASGKEATWQEIHMARLRNDKVVEHWACIDQLGMLQQLGFIPTPGQ